MKRKIEKLVDEQWVNYQMKDLKDGDIFRMTEPSGVPIANSLGKTQWTASGDAFLNEQNLWTIDIEDCI